MDRAELEKRTAKAVHETLRVFCEATKLKPPMVPWAVAPEWQKKATREGVHKIFSNPKINASQIHEDWIKVKKADGWVRGATKSPIAKTHPLMVPYAELPPEERAKDELFVFVVRRALSSGAQ